MKPGKFRYRLEKILELKRKKEDEEKEILGKLLAEEERQKQLKAQLEERLAQVRVELRAKQQAGDLDIEDLRRYPQHIRHLEHQIANQELKLQEIAIRILEQRQNLLRAAQERKTFERHREKCFEEFVAEQQAQEARRIDELATLKYARQQSPGAT